MTNEVENETQTSAHYRTLLRNDGTSAAPTGLGVVEFALQRFQDKTVWIAFGGHFNAGKSTLQNSLLGQDLLPSNDKPATGIACFVCPGDCDHAVAIDCEGNRAEIECSAAAIAVVSTLLDPITGEHKPESARAQAVQATVANSPVPHGVCWIDTPGINDTGEMDSRARGALNAADLVVWVLNSQQLLSEVEQRFIADYVAEHGTRSLVFVVNVFLRDDSQREWGEYIAKSQPAILNKIERFFSGLQPDGHNDHPHIFTVAARAIKCQPETFDADGFISFVRGNASFWEHVWLARSERLTMAMERRQAEEEQEVAARASAASLVRASELQRSSPFMTAALKAFDQEEYDVLLLNAVAAADHAPDESAPHVLRSIGLIFDQEYEFAVYAAERALRINPQNEEAYLARGWARVELGETPQALEDLNTFLDSPTAIGWQRTAALWSRARCTVDDEPKSACTDLAEACEDTLGLARLKLNAPALLFALAEICMENGQSSLAIDMYGDAMITAAPFESDELVEAFGRVCAAFSLDEITEPVLFSISRNAWEACEGVASGTEAAELFIDKIFSVTDGKSQTIDMARFVDNPDFFLYMASAYAKRNVPANALFFLKNLLTAKPDFDIKIAKTDQHIRACKSTELTEFLSPTFEQTSKAGTMMNYLTLKNTSAFRITNVTVKVSVTRSTGVVDAPMSFPANNLDAQQEQTWYELFTNPGMFGKNIEKIEVRVRCSELP